jgi:hypothetical protein
VSTEPQQSAAQPEPQKKSKATAIATGFAVVCLGIAGLANFAGFIGKSQTDAANKLKDQANLSIDEADKHTEVAKPLADAVFAPANITGVPGTRDAFRADAEKSAIELKAAADKLRKSAGLFDEAAKMKIDSHYSEYLALKSKQLTALADVKDNLVQQLQMMLDAKNDDGAKLKTTLDEMDGKIGEFIKQAGEHNEQADKIVAANPSVFTK